MTVPRRVGAETSKTRAVLLDSAEQLMLEEGYAAVTYRRVAAKSEVTAGLVQYYFPALDDLFVALLRRHSDDNLKRLVKELHDDAHQPLHVVWKYSSEETTAALMVEFMALANHRKAIRAEIAEVAERSQKVQIDALSDAWEKYGLLKERLSPAAALVLLHGIPKLVLLEGSLDISTGHTEVVTLVERYLELAEPTRPTKATRRAAVPSRAAAKKSSDRASRPKRAVEPKARTLR
jgi:AcrR family transcriptional regulator